MKQAEPWLVLANSCKSEDPLNLPLAPKPEKLLPKEVLHIGNDYEKDYVGARNAGFHAILLNRYGENEVADSWRQKGAPVCTDLIDVVEYLGREQFLLGPSPRL
jgi:FMN phosphatase YigB (HAD superfamily)